MEKHLNKWLLFLACLPLCGSCANNSKIDQLDIIDVASYVDITGTRPCSDKIQELINNNPHRTLYFRDGTYLLDHQILTPGDPNKSVDLKLSNYAILKASDNYQAKRSETERKRWQDDYLYMVSLGGLDRKNDVTLPGSVYGLTGGIIQGNKNFGVGGIEIAGGRETRVQNVSMKDVEVGLKIAYGVNSSSSDADVSDLDIICNETKDSLGVWIDGNDNTMSNVRIGHTRHGVLLTGGGNSLRNIHPLLNGDNAFEDYETSYGFYVRSQNVLNYCYADNFATAFKICRYKYEDPDYKGETRGVFSDCFTWWYNSHGHSYNMIENYGDFDSVFTNLSCGFGSEPSEGNHASILKIIGGGHTTHIDDPTESEGSHGLIENIFIANRGYLGDAEDLYKPNTTSDPTSFFRGVDSNY